MGDTPPDVSKKKRRTGRAGCGADEALFVGDHPEQDIVGANRAGLRSVLYAGPGAMLTGHVERENLSGDAQPRHTITRLPDILAFLE